MATAMATGQAIWAIYVWCRRTDDIVDGPRAMVRGKKSMQQDLQDVRRREIEKRFDATGREWGKARRGGMSRLCG